MDLRKVGFHVIEIQKFRKVADLPSLLQNISIISLLREIERGKLQKFSVVDGLDEFLKTSTDEAIEQARKTLNKAITDMLTIGASMVFVVKHNIYNIPDNPMICNKPLAMIFPRPHDIRSMEPGYLYYPIV